MNQVGILRRPLKRFFSSSAQKIRITGEPLTISQVVNVSREKGRIELCQESKERIKQCRRRVENIVSSNDTFYGINTGFGSLVNRKINMKDLNKLQENLIRSHASGVGKPLEKEIVRSMLFCLIGSLSRGLSGVRLELVEMLVNFLNNDITPVVPSLGSVGASGDLAPLAYCVLPLLGEGKVTVGNSDEIYTGKDILKKFNLTPLTLEAKEGLALINGTHLMCGSGALLCHDFLQLFRASLCATSLSMDALMASHAFLDPRINKARCFSGGISVSDVLRDLLAGSEIHENRLLIDTNVQDPYSIRCSAPILGASYEMFLHIQKCISIELGAVTDNPLVFSAVDDEDSTDIISAGNFHGMPIALPLDTLTIALAHVAGVSERRTNLMLSNKKNTHVGRVAWS